MNRLTFFGLLSVTAAMLMGCPESKIPESGSPTADTATVAPTATPTGTATATATAAALEGGWTLQVFSENPGINPAAFSKPAERAAMFYDHAAKVDGGRVLVEQKTLKKEFPLSDAAAAQKLEKAIKSTDWEAVKTRVKGDEAVDGGVYYVFTITVGDKKTEIETSLLPKHPELKALAEALKAASGVPGK
jgi:hypothetical protein